MDVINRSAELLVSQVGHLAFDIDRALLLMLLGNFYGLASSLADEKPQDDLPTKQKSGCEADWRWIFVIPFLIKIYPVFH